MIRTRPLLVALLAWTTGTCLAAGAAELSADRSRSAVGDVEGHAVSATFGPDGRLWRVVPHRASLDVAYSVDHGRSFSEPAVIDASRQRLRIDPEGRPGIVVNGRNYVYVAWTADARRPAQAFVSMSSDGGRSFSAPTAIIGPDEGQKLRVLLTLDRQDEPRLMYIDPEPRPRANHLGGQLMQARISGATAPAVVAMPMADDTCECCRLDAARDPDGNLAILSRMVFPGGIRDFGLVAERADGPAVLSRLTDDNWRIDACPEHGGALAIGADGRYHVAWFTQGQRRQGLFYGYSDDRGRTLAGVQALGNPRALAGHGDVLARDPRVDLAWQEFDGTRTTIMAMRSSDRGQTWSAATRLATAEGATDYPFLLADDTGVFVSWYTATAGYQLLPVADDSRSAVAPRTPRPFATGSFQSLVSAHAGRGFAVVIWSVDCAPCLREFQVFQGLLADGKQLPIVLVATDGADRSDEVTATLRRFGLDGLENWNFADANAQRLRFEIDPRWYGEMPRSYSYAADGSRTAHSGGLTRDGLVTWLVELSQTE